jgi:excisionase family DNA binding protein
LQVGGKVAIKIFVSIHIMCHTIFDFLVLTRREVPMLALMTEIELSERLNVSLASLRRWRLEGRGPRFVKVGSLVRYRPEDLDEWLASLPAGGVNLSRHRRVGSRAESAGSHGGDTVSN